MNKIVHLQFEEEGTDFQVDLPFSAVNNLVILWKKYGKFIVDKLKLDEITFKV
jgi:hypothetical protein